MNETSSKKAFAVSLFLVGALALGIYYFFIRDSSTAPVVAPTPEPVATATTSTQAGTTGATPEAQPVATTPNFKKPIAFAESVSPEIRTQLNTSLKAVQTQLQTNSLNMSAWINLGTLHKQGGDYAGAVEAWTFVSESLPTNVTPRFNLGDLYMNFLKDYSKAETNFLVVVKENPKIEDAYVNLYYLYHDFLKVNVKAAAILEEGLRANPGNQNLLTLQNQLQAGN